MKDHSVKSVLEVTWERTYMKDHSVKSVLEVTWKRNVIASRACWKLLQNEKCELCFPWWNNYFEFWHAWLFFFAEWLSCANQHVPTLEVTWYRKEHSIKRVLEEEFKATERYYPCVPTRCAIHDEVFCERNNAKKKTPAQFSPGIQNLTISEVSFNNSWQPRNQYIFIKKHTHRIHCGFLVARHLFVCHCYTCQYTSDTCQAVWGCICDTNHILYRLMGCRCVSYWWFQTWLDYFPFHIWDNPKPIDELIFFKMVIAPPTRFLRRTLLYPGDLRCPWQGCRNPTRARAPWPVPGYPGYLGNPTE